MRSRESVARSLGLCARDELPKGGVLGALKEATGIDGTWRQVFCRLETLIDPTCETYERKNETEECSACGSVIYMQCIAESMFVADVAAYCPACGARIERAEDGV